MLRPINNCFKLKNSLIKVSTVISSQKLTIQRTINEEDVNIFAKVTGDYNPVHFAAEGKPGLVHGALLNGLVSGIIGTKLPGPGTLLVSQEMKFPNPCFIGDTISISVELISSRKISECKFEIINSDKKPVLIGSAKLLLT